ncbi:DeoR family transcriptional regulator [Listeria floridensis FSL S10-1187]|uniref:DeoR family transcriptional regulator n=1 Tax=Listeria floridensis FSL S10-1187 TaxID=1265817 RepID=A0ABN0RCY6_9LIST|nr:DeoR/GlpR family DNA-binding transcription regulator [Listeria floridensis]EUJ28209.1 DeoR family transcriptional regulator [Listeria floridensis FSL S10-1187]
MFDSSTTVEAFIRELGETNLYAITNSLTHAQVLAKNPKAEISVLPGTLHKEQLFLYGSETVQKIADYQADYAILGVFAISSGGLFIHTEEEGFVKRQMANHAKTVIALADHTKIGTSGFFKVCDLEEIDYLVTDRELSEEFCEVLRERNVQWIIAMK